MKKNIKEAIKEHLYAKAFVADPNNTSFVDRFLEHTKAAEWGANWRINSVWHDMKSEEPQVYGEYENEVYPQIPCLVRGQLSTGYGYGVRYWNTTEKVWDDEECDDFECKKDDIEKWAYLDDLIPNTEE